MALGALVTWMVLLGLCDDVCALPAPSGLSMTSVNMIHTLSWLPLQEECNTTALYSVQYQGEFERLILNRTWLDAGRCQLTSGCQCDLTSELASDSDYDLRVRAHCGCVLSPWQQLAPPFNRNRTLLLPPRLKVDVLGDSLLVSLGDVPHICSVRLTLWRSRPHKQVLAVVVVRSEQVALDSPPLLQGEEYCVQAQSELPSGLRSSPTAPHCVHVPGPGGWPWEKWVTVAFVLFLSVGFFGAVVWFTVHGRPQLCLRLFHREALPHSLKDWDDSLPETFQKLQKPQEEVHTVKVVQGAPPPSTMALLWGQPPSSGVDLL